MRILSPEDFLTSAWKNGGGVTHEIARHEDANGSWAWRLSIAEVACDGPFSRFDGMSRILTVIEGAGLELHTPDGVMRARPLLPLHFSGGLAVEGRMVDGPIRDLNVIHDANLIDARVTLIDNPCRLDAGPDLTGFLAISGQITVDGAALPAGAFALGSDGVVEIGARASGILVTLRELP